MTTIPDDEFQAAWEAWHRAWNEPSASTARDTLRIAMTAAARVRAARPVSDEEVEAGATEAWGQRHRAMLELYTPVVMPEWRTLHEREKRVVRQEVHLILTAARGAPPSPPTDKDQQIARLTEALNRARDYLAPVADQRPVRAALAVLDAVFRLQAACDSINERLRLDCTDRIVEAHGQGQEQGWRDALQAAARAAASYPIWVDPDGPDPDAQIEAAQVRAGIVEAIQTLKPTDGTP